MRVALIQFNAGPDKEANLRRAEGMVRQALARRAQFVLLPEIFAWRGNARDKALLAQAAERIPGPVIGPFAALAKQYKTHILLGSVFEKIPGTHKAYNASVLISSDGKVAAKYRKINLFDARINGKIIRESDCLAPGRRGKTAKVNGFSVGLSVCYDLRFPEIYRGYARAGADILTVPSCFTKTTGQAHWEVLLRSRAIENLSYVLAPNQVGKDSRGIAAYGNSMIVAPWGEVIARGSGTREEIIYGSVEKNEIAKARAILPGVA